MFYIYVLQSQKNQHYYIGVTKSLAKRLQQHNNGSTRSTRPYRPWKVIYTESFSDKRSAYKREFHLKNPKGYQDKLAILRGIKAGRDRIVV